MLASDYDEKRMVQLPEVNIKVIPHSEQRYPTAGDYWFDEQGVLQIRVSKINNAKYEWLVATHEFAEAIMVLMKGINFKDIDEFDMKFEDVRSKFPEIIGDKEPGDNELSPYFHEHQMASRIEHWLGDSTGVEWLEYGKSIWNL